MTYNPDAVERIMESDPDVAALIRERRAQPESELARQILASERKPRAKVMCRQRHRLAAVYGTPESGYYIVIPARVFRSGSLFLDGAPDEPVVFVEWAEKLDLDNPRSVRWLLRCHCHMYSTTEQEVVSQLSRLAPADDWILCSISAPADHPNSVILRERAERVTPGQNGHGE